MADIRVFRINKSFVRELRQRLSNKKAEMIDSFPDSRFFPNQSQLETLVETLVWASIQYEEGRLARLRVTYAEPIPFEHLGLVFRESKELNIEELRKLAPAILPPDGQIGVWPLAPGKRLRIWGLQTNNLSGTTFETIDPGRLIVRFMGRFTIAEIKGQDAGFISAEWNDQTYEMMSGQYANDTTPAGMARAFFCSHFTEEILRRIRLLKHGGTILFVTDLTRWAESIDRPLFYDCERYLDKVQPIANKLDQMLRELNVNEQIGKQRFSAVQTVVNFTQDYQSSIGDAARAIGYLSAIDGATILDKNFRVLGFGSKIRSAGNKENRVTVETLRPLEGEAVSHNIPLDEEFRGTRHQSAARFVLSNPGSRAIVVSQDGGVTGMAMRSSEDAKTEGIVVYRGLELSL